MMRIKCQRQRIEIDVSMEDDGCLSSQTGKTYVTSVKKVCYKCFVSSSVRRPLFDKPTLCAATTRQVPLPTTKQPSRQIRQRRSTKHNI